MRPLLPLLSAHPRFARRPAAVARAAALFAGLFAAVFATACQPAEDDITLRTLQYGPLPEQRADVYMVSKPDSSPPRPAVLLIHGGGWVAGSRREFGDLAKWLARQGLVPVAIDYRLVTQATWPAQADDVEQAVWWLRENAASLHADASRVVALGGSAGGHLAAWLGTTNRVNAHGTPSRVNVVVSMWGPWDLTAPNVREDGKNMIAALVGHQPPRDASPLFRVDSRSAPTLVIHGTADELVPPDQSTRACDALHAVKVDCELMLLPGEGHGLDSGHADPVAVVQRLKAFLDRHL